MSRPASRVLRWTTALLYRWSHKQAACGITVAVLLPRDEDTAVAYPKVEAALHLIRQHDPRRFARIVQDVRAIFLTENSVHFAEWFDDLRFCQLARRYVLSPKTTAELLASTIVHEAMHGRLCRMGIGYEAAIRQRVEGICFRAEREFADRIPDGHAIRERVDAQLKYQGEVWSDANIQRRQFAALRQLGVPERLISVLARVVGRRPIK